MTKTVAVEKEASYSGSYQTESGINLKAPYSFFGSTFGPEEIEAIAAAMQQETMTMGPMVERFQKEFAEYLGVKHAFAVCNCTTALYLATQLIGIRPGDEVITTPMTYIATSMSPLRQGARIVFADVDPRTVNLDPQSVAEKITPDTKAIYVVHYAGQAADMDPIMQLAQQFNLAVVEDVAHAPGALYKGRKVGSIGDIGCFSFHSLKNMTCLGEGGMLVTNNDAYAAKVPLLRCLNMQAYANQRDYWLPYHYDIVEVDEYLGHKFLMNEVQAAVGRVQLRKLDALNSTRRAHAHWMSEKLSTVAGITVPYEDPNCLHAYHLYTLMLDDPIREDDRDEFLRILYREEGVQAILHYLPVYLFTLYKKRGYEPGLCPVAERTFRRLLNLPIHPRLTQIELHAMVDGVANAVQKLLERRG
jgi:perosamine synthetase